MLEHFIENGSRYNLKTDKFGLAGESVGGMRLVHEWYRTGPKHSCSTNIIVSLGNMAIAMTQLAQSRNLRAKIGQLVLLYPVTDTHAKSETYKTFEHGPYLAEKTMDWMISAFLPNEADRRTALASPLAFAPDEVLAKFPPTTIFVSGADPLIGEGEAFGRRLQQLGVDTANKAPAKATAGICCRCCC